MDSLFLKAMHHLKEQQMFIQEVDELYHEHNLQPPEYDMADQLAADLVEAYSRYYNDDIWIGYWVYECNCGLDWKPGMVTTPEGDDIPFRTPEDLLRLIR